MSSPSELTIEASAHDPHRVVVVGCGQQAQNAWLPALVDDSRVTVTALVDARPDRLAQCASRFQIGRAYMDATKAFNAERPEVVVIATLPAAHAHLAQAAASAGARLIICEKPPGISVQDAIAIAQAQAMGAIVYFGFKFRHMQPAAEEFMRTDGPGAILDVSAEWGRAGEIPADQVPNQDPAALREFNGGGVVPDLLSHMLAEGLHHLDWWTADELSVDARALTWRDGMLAPWDESSAGVECQARGVIHGPSADLRFDVAWRGSPVALGDRVRLVLTCERGVLEVPYVTTEHNPNRLCPKFHYLDGTVRDLWIPRPLGEHEAYRAQLDGALACLERGAEPPVDGRRGIVIQRIIAATLASAAAGGERQTVDQISD